VNEWPDIPAAVRACAAGGPAVPAIAAVGYESFCEAVSEVFKPLFDPDVGIRITSEFGWVVALAESF